MGVGAFVLQPDNPEGAEGDRMQKVCLLESEEPLTWLARRREPLQEK